MKNQLKTQRVMHFTLIELLVVIAIIAILAILSRSKNSFFSAVFCHLSIFFFLEKSTLQSKTRCYLVLKITSNKIRLCLITTNIITDLLSNC